MVWVKHGNIKGVKGDSVVGPAGKDGESIKGDPGRDGKDAPIINKIDLKKTKDEISLIFKLSDDSKLETAEGIKIKEIRGKSAYEIAVDNGFHGTEKQWLNSLVSKVPGPAGIPGLPAPAIVQHPIDIDSYLQKFLKDKGPFPGTGDGTGGPDKKKMKEEPYLTRGPVGPKGNDGYSVLNGTSAPTIMDGTDGDFWIDTTAWKIYGPKGQDAVGEWPAGVQISGGVNLNKTAEIDQPSDTLTYYGLAMVINANTASAIWQIFKIDTSTGESVKTFASGNSNYDKIWDNRASYTYS